MKNIFTETKSLKWNGLSIYLKSSELPDRDLLLVSGGRKPDPTWLKSLASEKIVWSIDSGADHCRDAGIVPQRAIGDFDSISPVSMEWLRSNRVIMETYKSDKDLTDLQLSLDLCEKEAPLAFVTVTGCWGGRFDHVWSTINSIMKANTGGGYFRFLGDNQEMMGIMKGGDRLKISSDDVSLMPEVISLLSFSDLCKGVSIEGVRWTLDKRELERNYPYSISNRPVQTDVEVSLDSGWLGVYLLASC